MSIHHSNHETGHHQPSPNHAAAKAQLTPAMVTLLAVGVGVIAFLIYVTLYALNTTPANALEMMR